MNTLELEGNLLNMFVALALGGVEGENLFVPFDAWDCGIVYGGDTFSPHHDVAAIWPEVMRLRISTTDTGDGRWVVAMPTPPAGQSLPFPPYLCTNPLDGYRYAIVWSVFGSEVPDTYESVHFGLVNLVPYNKIAV
ncbi:hypothetical protein VNPA120661_57790 [Pseudomonas aeruginosa]|jgi:hypothetical protein|uniref:Uncharacterized protein n=1 Tax=Pseudomonas aeruginosa TaxID=287 RepID=A0A6C0L6A9_PSEAI|nr:hypothetical protein [Pseudomonas aeruginosa]MDS9749574.1 hypothetical protein [Pseudomonas aeruginosa]MDS9772005.1 hypothetical protein [Pseudomonas aeruginosa]QHU24374.1 hypothetical protein [Pseudomonas aeruginosa]QZH54206.1 hypothetical protein K5A80_35680 [Pseudomonas aeruginosa]RUJ11746.1 hypothetical protein IPC380_30935 [Pseudomonas aeruginosa]